MWKIEREKLRALFEAPRMGRDQAARRVSDNTVTPSSASTHQVRCYAGSVYGTLDQVE